MTSVVRRPNVDYECEGNVVESHTNHIPKHSTHSSESWRVVGSNRSVESSSLRGEEGGVSGGIGGAWVPGKEQTHGKQGGRG